MGKKLTDRLDEDYEGLKYFLALWVAIIVIFFIAWVLSTGSLPPDSNMKDLNDFKKYL